MCRCTKALSPQAWDAWMSRVWTRGHVKRPKMETSASRLGFFLRIEWWRGDNNNPGGLPGLCANMWLWNLTWLGFFGWHVRPRKVEFSCQCCYFWEANGPRQDKNEWTLMRAAGVTVCLWVWVCEMRPPHSALCSQALAPLNLVFLFFHGATAGVAWSPATIVLCCD